MNEWSNAKLCDIANLVLGLFLLLSPWIVGYSGSPEQNALISGRTPAAQHGRAFAAAGALIQTAIGVGTAAASPLVALLRADGAMIAAGAVTCVIAAIAWALTGGRPDADNRQDGRKGQDGQSGPEGQKADQPSSVGRTFTA